MKKIALASIERHGFAILRRIFSAEFLDHTMSEVTRLALRRSRAGVRHALRLQPVAKIATCPQLTQFAHEVLGPYAFPFRATFFEKTPATNWLVVWHQDTALPLCERSETRGWGPWSVKEGITYAHAPASVLEHVLALRVHFDDSTQENGPLRVLPGTHHSGVMSDDEIHAFSTTTSPVDCLVSKGGVVAMRPLLVHSSSKSRSGSSRRVLHIEYAASDLIADPLRLAIA